MRQRRFHTLGFLLVLLAAVTGAYLARTLVGPVESPNLEFVGTIQSAVEALALGSFLPGFGPSLPAQQSPASESAPEVAVAESPPAQAEPPPAAAEGPAASPEAAPAPSATPATVPAIPAERATATPAPPTPTPTPAVVPSFAFLPLGDLRHGNDGCPGPSIRGAVRDAGGNPLPGVRIWRYDQWGNEQTVESKSAEADLGQYDFPLGDSANIHYVQIVDASGAPISPRVEVPHRQGPAADAACHWIDWVRR